MGTESNIHDERYHTEPDNRTSYIELKRQRPVVMPDNKLNFLPMSYTQYQNLWMSESMFMSASMSLSIFIFIFMQH